MEKVVIIGSGVAGLTAAIYAARAELKPLIISGMEEGGQLATTTEVENFPGFPAGVMGPEFMANCKKQAERFGTRFIYGAVEKVEKIKEGVKLIVNSQEIKAEVLIIATGASARWLNLPSEQKYKGRGISSCATCDAAFYKSKEVLVIGGGDAAMEEALFMTRFTDKVTLVHRGSEFRASKIMQERLKKNKIIKIMWNKEIVEYLGDGRKINAVKLKDTKNNSIEEKKCDGVFLAIGHVPNTSFLKGFVDLDEKCYLKADRFMHTSVEGVFAAGDVQDYRYRQAISAAGTGCMAAMEAEKYLGEK
ncbi:thioredoxin-disulfide reductase [Candidatus Woesearchaeota archaeon]|nr:thioredoxin-disulfide reductase [Candidatus Woesearchaeota archaeon]